MNLPRFSVKNSLFVNLLAAVVVAAGIISGARMKREAFPPVAFDVVTVATRFSGASAGEVEKLVTVPLERELREVENVTEMLSVSEDASSVIALKIAPSEKNRQKIMNDIQRAVDRVTDLPGEITERPEVAEITSGQIPVVKIALSGGKDEFALRAAADELKDLLMDIEGVSSVKKAGYRREEYRVEPDADRMKAAHVSFDELARALKGQDADMAGGK